MSRPPAESYVSYQVLCVCGRSLRGQRQETRQIISCSHCGRKRFILAKSPWLAPVATVPVGQPALGSMKRFLLLIVVGGALAMALIFLLVRPYLRRTGPPPDIQALYAEAEQQLRQGNVFLALEDLNAAIEQRARHPTALSREEHHRLERLWRQTDLLTRLLDQPLEDILHQAIRHRSDAEWNAKFEHYRGRSVVFDDVLRRGLQELSVVGSYVVRAGDVEARLALEDLALLRQLPLEPPRRWLFGVRLTSCRREEGGTWVIRFDPESAVLLSDEIIASACCPQPLDEELLAVLRRQDEWLRR